MSRSSVFRRLPASVVAVVWPFFFLSRNFERREDSTIFFFLDGLRVAVAADSWAVVCAYPHEEDSVAKVPSMVSPHRNVRFLVFIQGNEGRFRLG